MKKRSYVFIDESGDPGNILENGASSPHYAELALQINEEAWTYFIEHIISWKYVWGRFKELNSLPSRVDQLKRYINPLIELNNRSNLCCSCVYLIKANYTGPYLRTSSTHDQNPIKFRNFVHRKLLEHHFGCFPTHDYGIELVFDRYRMTTEEENNLKEYLINNWNLPNFEYICHVNSIYSEAMQVTSQLVNATKDIILGTADGNRKSLLDFIVLKDITTP
jgi:hypothetical protein